MEKERKYKITKETYQNKSWMWDPEAEIFLSLFLDRVVKIRKFSYNAEAEFLLKRYLAKKENSKVGPTQIMRHAIGKK